MNDDEKKIITNPQDKIKELDLLLNAMNKLLDAHTMALHELQITNINVSILNEALINLLINKKIFSKDEMQKFVKGVSKKFTEGLEQEKLNKKYVDTMVSASEKQFGHLFNEKTNFS